MDVTPLTAIEVNTVNKQAAKTGKTVQYFFVRKDGILDRSLVLVGAKIINQEKALKL